MAAILDFRTFMGQILVDFFLFIHYIQQYKKPLRNLLFYFFGGSSGYLHISPRGRSIYLTVLVSRVFQLFLAWNFV